MRMNRQNKAKNKAAKPLIGFIGQGFIGKNYADDFEHRGYSVVRYALEKPYQENKEKIKNCDLVFIAVPTPTTPKGFDDSIVRKAIALVGKGKIVIIKSTILPGSTKSFRKQYPDRIIFYSPEFLSEATAAQDASNPFSNILGMSTDNEAHRRAAKHIHTLLPKAPFILTCDSTEAEIIKYAHNGSGYTQIIFFNLMYDLAEALGGNWNSIQSALLADPLISSRYAKPIHKSGRGAGGHCFIKDFAALRGLHKKHLPKDRHGHAVFKAAEHKNKHLLLTTKKDLDLLTGVYGKKVLKKKK